MAVLTAALLVACGSTAKPPDWKIDAADLIERYKAAALKGESTLAEGYFRQAVQATGGAAQIEATARLWLVRCGVRRAMLIDDPCTDYRALTGEQGSAADATYYRYLTLDWDGLDAQSLPAAHARVLGRPAAERNAALAALDDPLARLLAASLLLQRKEGDATTLAIAADTAAERGWTQPLLVFLTLQREHARAAGDAVVEARLSQKIRLVEDSLKNKLPKK